MKMKPETEKTKVMAHFCSCPGTSGPHKKGCPLGERLKIKYYEHPDWTEEQIDEEMTRRRLI